MPENKGLQFHLVSQDRVVFEGPADEIILPTSSGQITVLSHHIPLVTVVVPGEIIVRHGSSEDTFAVAGGFLEVRNNVLTLLADASERASEIDHERAKNARKKAEQSLREGVEGEQRMEAAYAYERALARLRVVQRIADRRGKNISS